MPVPAGLFVWAGVDPLSADGGAEIQPHWSDFLTSNILQNIRRLSDSESNNISNGEKVNGRKYKKFDLSKI